MTTTRRRQPRSQREAESAATGYESELWKMADALRGSMDAAEYKHVVLGLIFLKYISDAFEEAYARLEAERDQGADPEDPDEYRAQSIFWVPPEARWRHLQDQARQPAIGRLVDDAMIAVERDNPALRDVLPKEYSREGLDKQWLGQVVDLVSNVQVGGAEAQANDVLGQVYEYFLEQFAIAEGRKGGEFYTPRSVVRLLVEMLEPYQGRVYDPCCGSSGMFVQETNDSAVQVLGDETLRAIAQELVQTVRSNVTIDWTLRENVRAQLRVLVRRILRRHGYPPDKQEQAAITVLEQAELLSEGWASAD